MGDCRSNPKMFEKISRLMSDKQPYFSVYSGDLCYDGSYDSWKTEFFIPEQLELISRVPFFNSIGNHESWGQNTKAFTHSPASKSGMMDYYSFDYGDVHFIIINSEADVKPGSKQYNFVKKDLKATTQKWKIAVFHIPAYCAGGHNENKNMIKLCNDLFEPGKVDLVITGHSHFYQHNYVAGVHHFVIAGGGAPLYTPKKRDYVVKSRKIHHYGVFDVSPENIKLTVYDSNDSVIDTVEIKK
jgi:predicted phosphodiesterase